MKTKISSFFLLIIFSGVWVSAYASSAPSQSANLINVNGTSNSPTQAPTPVPTKNYQVCYAVVCASCNAFTGLVTIQNKGTTPINGWTVRWNYLGNQAVVYALDGNATQSGKTVSVANASCNQSIPAGGTACFGFQACYSGANINPTVFSLQ